MSPKPRDITGLRSGRLVVVELVGIRQGKRDRVRLWRCRCDCGNEPIVAQRYLIDGGTKSCGCLIGQHKRTHGATGSREYRVWDSMRRRCLDPKNENYFRYGARGITVCERWLKFENFLADMGPRPHGMSLDRRDNDGPYDANNCHWATPMMQSNNRRSNLPVTYSGQTKNAAEWEHLLRLKPGIVSRRLAQGWSVEKALKPPRTYADLTFQQVHECRTSGLSDAYYARLWSVTSTTVRNARRGETYQDHPTPADTRQRFAGGRYESNYARLEQWPSDDSHAEPRP